MPPEPLEREEPLPDSFAAALQQPASSEYVRAEAYVDILKTAVARRSAQLQREERGHWTSAGDRFENVRQELQVIKHERNTWMLATALLREDLEHKREVKQFDDVVEHGLFPSDRNVINFAKEETTQMRQQALVVGWLEAVAAQEHNELLGDVMFETDLSHGWINTLEEIKRSKRPLPGSKPKPTATLLDPDAPHRQQRPLAERDVEGERALMQKLFTLVRIGKLAKAKELCRSCGQSWRAAALEGGTPRHYEDHTKDMEGFKYREMWRAVCLRLCADPSVDVHERALFATLCGHLDTLMLVCRSWHDALWAHFLSMHFARTEERFSMLRDTVQPGEQLPKDLAIRAKLTPEIIFESLEASPMAHVKDGAQDPPHIIQKMLILNDYEGLLALLSSWSRDAGKAPYFRLFAHLAIFLRRLMPGQLDDEQLEMVVRAYAQHLVDTSAVSAVATYTAELREGDRVAFHVAFLAPIAHPDLRRQLLELAAQAQLDTRTIAAAVAKQLFAENAALIGPSQEAAIVSSIDWLLCDPLHRCCGVAHALRVTCHCLLAGRNAVARQAFEKIAENSDELIEDQERQGRIDQSTTHVYAHAPPRDLKHEANCLRALLDALDMYDVWQRHADVRPAASTAEWAHWERIAESNTDFCDKKIDNVLMFPGGWLLNMDWPETADELRTLRHRFVPLLCRLKHTILYQTGRYAQSLKIADIIAREHYKLVDLFQAERGALCELLGLLRESAIRNLESGGSALE